MATNEASESAGPPAKLGDPAAHRFPAGLEAALREQLLHVAKARSNAKDSPTAAQADIVQQIVLGQWGVTGLSGEREAPSEAAVTSLAKLKSRVVRG